MQLGDSAYQEQLVAALNADDGFVLETRWFDGAILLEAGPQRLWLKVYRGRVIDHLAFVPPFGYSFKVTGSEAAWELLASGERTFTDLATAGSRHAESLEEIERGGGGFRPPELAIEGDGFAAGRVHLALIRLAVVVRATAQATLAAA